MIHIAPRRPKGLACEAWWNIQADSASEPTFFSAPVISARSPPVAT